MAIRSQSKEVGGVKEAMGVWTQEMKEGGAGEASGWGVVEGEVGVVARER